MGRALLVVDGGVRANVERAAAGSCSSIASPPSRWSRVNEPNSVDCAGAEHPVATKAALTPTTVASPPTRLSERALAEERPGGASRLLGEPFDDCPFRPPRAPRLLAHELISDI